MNNIETENLSQDQEFDRLGKERRPSFLAEYLYVLRSYKKLWMLPIVLVLLMFGLLMVLSSSGVAPFIYTLF